MDMSLLVLSKGILFYDFGKLLRYIVGLHLIARIIVFLIFILCWSTAFANPVIDIELDPSSGVINIHFNEPGYKIYSADTGDIGLPMRLYANNIDITDQCILKEPIAFSVKIADRTYHYSAYQNDFSIVVPKRYLKNSIISFKAEACKDQCILIDKTFEPEFGFQFTIILLGFIGGVLLNFMPCVLPVLGLKVFQLLKSNYTSSNKRAIGFGTTIGIVLSFLTIALIVIALKTTTTVLHFQNPIFIYAVSLLMLILGYNLWHDIDSFAFFAPLFRRLKVKKKYSIFINAVLSGMLSVVMATPCTAPFISNSIAFAMISGPSTIILLYGVISLGFSLPFILFTLWPNIITKITPKAGAWMMNVRRLFALMMIISAIWFLSILFEQLSIRAWLLCICFIILVRFSMQFHYLLALLCIAMALSMPFALDEKISATQIAQDASWQKFSHQLLKHALADGKPVFVDITANWCITCKINSFVALNQSTVDLLLKHNVLLLRGDITNYEKESMSFLAGFKRNGVPFNVLYLQGHAPIIMPVLFTYNDITSYLLKN